MRAGYVPTARIAPLVAELIEDRWPHGNGRDVLAEKIGYDESHLRKLLNQTHAEVDFDFADRVLCALGRPDMWWGVLGDVYYECDLRTAQERNNRFVPETRKCEHCDSEFLAAKDTRRFCSRECRSKTAWLRKHPFVELTPRSCLWCEEEYMPKRNDSRFCSIRCMNQHGYYKGGGAEKQHARRMAA
jgi:hypothetical protein